MKKYIVTIVNNGNPEKGHFESAIIAVTASSHKEAEFKALKYIVSKYEKKYKDYNGYRLRGLLVLDSAELIEDVEYCILFEDFNC